MSPEQQLREQLADFLKQRRSRILPQKVGLPAGKRRRVTGLRREEVAELADISATWYAWIEQARPVTLSGQTLEALSQALRLDSFEREYLFQLAGLAAPPTRPRETQTPDVLQRCLDQMHPWPAYAYCPRWSLMGWNQAADRVFGPFSNRPPAQRNLLWLAFMEPAYRSLWIEWERFARCTLNHFRADFQFGICSGPGSELVEQLLEQSTEFRAWWPEHQVSKPGSWQKRLRHPELGLLTLDPCTMRLEESSDLVVCFYVPADSESRIRLGG